MIPLRLPSCTERRLLSSPLSNRRAIAAGYGTLRISIALWTLIVKWQGLTNYNFVGYTILQLQNGI
jgi:hypothetical protein